MTRTFPLEFSHIFSDGCDDVAAATEKPDALDNFFATTELEHSAGIDLQKYDREIALIDAEHRQVYVAIAKAAADASPTVNDNTLAKRASGQRIEKSLNGRWEYFYDSRGELVSGRETNP